MLNEVVTTLRPLAEAKGLTFELSMPAQDVMVRTDRRALSQILLNLTNNAIKFTETGSCGSRSRKPAAETRRDRDPRHRHRDRHQAGGPGEAVQGVHATHVARLAAPKAPDSDST